MALANIIRMNHWGIPTVFVLRAMIPAAHAASSQMSAAYHIRTNHDQKVCSTLHFVKNALEQETTWGAAALAQSLLVLVRCVESSTELSLTA